MKHPFTVVHWYLIPLVALVVWWGMLIALLLAWSLQGKPMYKFMDEYQNPVYISDIGATNLQPLFISCVGFQAIFFVGTPLIELFLRKTHRIQPYVGRWQPYFAVGTIVCAIIGQLGILFVSIFNTNLFHEVHLLMVGVFIAFIFLACVCNFWLLFVFGWHPQKLSPEHHHVVFGPRKWQNLYMVSFVCKLFWMVAAVVFAICFGAYMRDDSNSTSAIFEWTISFWYGVLLILWSLDLFPAASRHYNRKHQGRFGDNEMKLLEGLDLELRSASSGI